MTMPDTIKNDDRDRVRQLNDSLRTKWTGGRVMVTRGVSALPPAQQAAILLAIVGFDDFSPENDPYGEHDFGALEVCGQRVFWKIDYYDLTLTTGSPDPGDASVTTRVLTIMLAEEY